jgi:hypothetical protein
MKTRIALSIALFAAAFGCGGVHRGHLFPVPDENSTFFNKSKGIAVLKQGVAVVVAPMNDVKEADAFYIVVFNKSGQWASFDRNEIRLLDQFGNSYKPMTRQEQNFVLGARFQPQPPFGIAGDVFRWDRTLNTQGDWVSPLNPEEVIKTSVMHGGKSPLFVFFRRQSGKSSRLTLVLPNVELGSSLEKLTYVFRFEVQKG